jgi:hypothetical protein
LSVFLFDEEEWGGIGTLGWTYVAFLNVFFDELLERFLFFLSEGVYFSR